MFDLLVTGGLVVDGTGATAPFRADVGVTGMEVSAVGDLSRAAARRRIDATGLVVAPGFIDTHCHSDGALLIDRQHANGLRQGVTTEILAPDGLSYAPLSPADYRMYRWYLSGALGLPPEDLDMSSIDAFRRNYHRKTAVNVVAMVPHGPVRLSAVGFRDVPLRGEALEKAKRMVREGIEQGARGFSTGLSYYPNSYSDTQELIELCKVAAEYGLPYSTHLRNHNTDRAFGSGGIAEALEIGRRAGVPVHIEHYRTSPATAGQVDRLMATVDAAKAEGVDVSLEAYPYPMGSGFVYGFFPGWVHEGGPEAMLERLQNPETRARVIADVEALWEAGDGAHAWSWIGSQRNKRLEGVDLVRAAEMRETSVPEMIVDVLIEERLTCGRRGAAPIDAAAWRQVEEDFMQLLSRDDYMIGSDAVPFGEMCHPRAYGTFPRAVGRLRRRYGYPLEQVVQRVTDNPARRFGLTKRGRIEEGCFADLVVFDSERMNDLSSYEDPRVHPAGIPFVVVNGQVAVEHERCTGVMAGQAVP